MATLYIKLEKTIIEFFFPKPFASPNQSICYGYIKQTNTIENLIKGIL